VSTLVDALANLLNASDAGTLNNGGGSSSARATVVSVDDPQQCGRVLVVFDDMNGQDIPQSPGSGEYADPRSDQAGNHSHWINVCPAFKGKQPPGLVGKRVTISCTNGDLCNAVLGDVIYDPDSLTEAGKKKLGQPNNSSMTRLPVYPSGSEPAASAENVGLCIVITNGFQGYDWLSVCLKRGSSYKWVNMMDRLHTHGSQENDSRGDKEGKVNDDTKATT
jgi:hypothetical protein